VARRGGAGNADRLRFLLARRAVDVNYRFEALWNRRPARPALHRNSS